MTNKNHSCGPRRSTQVTINFYEPDCWEGRTIRRFTGSRFTHVVPEMEGVGFHVGHENSQWVRMKTLHRLTRPSALIELPVRMLPKGLINDLLAPISWDPVALASWSRSRGRGHHYEQPHSCISAARLFLTVCGVATEQGTPDELYEQLWQTTRVSSGIGRYGGLA